MEGVGIGILAAGIWVFYCGLYGIPPVETARAIVLEPANARTIINAARVEADKPYGDLISASKTRAFGVSRGAVGGVNPYVVFPISDNFAAHKARGSGGGTDYMMPVGTPVLTPKKGIVANVPNNGTGGHTTRIKFDDGYTLVLMHLSKFLKNNGDTVGAMTPVALSGGAKGAEGAGSSTGPHLHVHVIDPNGNIIDYEKYITGAG